MQPLIIPGYHHQPNQHLPSSRRPYDSPIILHTYIYIHQGVVTFIWSHALQGLSGIQGCTPGQNGAEVALLRRLLTEVFYRREKLIPLSGWSFKGDFKGILISVFLQQPVYTV